MPDTHKKKKEANNVFISERIHTHNTQYATSLPRRGPRMRMRNTPLMNINAMRVLLGVNCVILRLPSLVGCLYSFIYLLFFSVYSPNAQTHTAHASTLPRLRLAEVASRRQWPTIPLPFSFMSHGGMLANTQHGHNGFCSIRRNSRCQSKTGPISERTDNWASSETEEYVCELCHRTKFYVRSNALR